VKEEEAGEELFAVISFSGSFSLLENCISSKEGPRVRLLVEDLNDIGKLNHLSHSADGRHPRGRKALIFPRFPFLAVRSFCQMSLFRRLLQNQMAKKIGQWALKKMSVTFASSKCWNSLWMPKIILFVP